MSKKKIEVAAPPRELEQIEAPDAGGFDEPIPEQVKLVGLVPSDKLLGTMRGYRIVTVTLSDTGIDDMIISPQAYLIQEAKHRAEMALEDAVRQVRKTAAKKVLS